MIKGTIETPTTNAYLLSFSSNCKMFEIGQNGRGVFLSCILRRQYRNWEKEFEEAITYCFDNFGTRKAFWDFNDKIIRWVTTIYNHKLLVTILSDQLNMMKFWDGV